jgi:hypothetical protein
MGVRGVHDVGLPAVVTLLSCARSDSRDLTRSVVPVQFNRALRDRVLGGEITLSFRLWSRPKVKVGGRYAVESQLIEVDTIELVPFSSVTQADVRRSGEPDLETMRRRVAHAGPVADDTVLYRIEFHVVRQIGP